MKNTFSAQNVKNNHSSTSDLLEYTKSWIKKHDLSFSKNCTLHENIKVSWLKQKPRTLQKRFKPSFKPMIENLQKKVHQRERKQSNGAKTCASIRWD